MDLQTYQQILFRDFKYLIVLIFPFLIVGIYNLASRFLFKNKKSSKEKKDLIISTFLVAYYFTLGWIVFSMGIMLIGVFIVGTLSFAIGSWMLILTGLAAGVVAYNVSGKSLKLALVVLVSVTILVILLFYSGESFNYLKYLNPLDPVFKQHFSL